MKSEELTLLQDISASSAQVAQTTRASLGNRVNAYLVLLSLVSLAEATVAAALIANAMIFPVRVVGDALTFLFMVLSFVALGVAVRKVNGLLHKQIGYSVVAEELETPYFHPVHAYRDVDEISKNDGRFFQQPLESFSGYEDIDEIYRRWVFQKGQAARLQIDMVKKVDELLGSAHRWLIASFALMLVSAANAAIGFGL